jgi:hypothetical protein
MRKSSSGTRGVFRALLLVIVLGQLTERTQWLSAFDAEALGVASISMPTRTWCHAMYPWLPFRHDGELTRVRTLGPEDIRAGCLPMNRIALS